MRPLILILILLSFVCLWAEETNPINAYFNSPSPRSFTAAYDFCAAKLTEDSTLVSMRILMANLAVLEADRLTAEVMPEKAALDASGRFQFANLLLAQRRYGDAVELYEGLNRDYPTWSCPWRHKGQALYEQQQYKAAEQALEQAIATNKEHYDAYVWMAKTQYQLKKYKPALQNLETALSLNPAVEESSDTDISEDSIRQLHDQLLKKTGKKK
jgi:tetratricopeptide (TPR) repeat protein